MSSSSRIEQSRVDTGRLADLITLLRMASAVVLALVLGRGSLQLAAIVVTAAWVSDAIDGRIARRWEGAILGRWDVVADAMVAAGAMIGLSINGRFSPWLTLLVVIVLGGLLLAGNLAAGMLLQLSGFVPLLWTLWSERVDLWWLPITAALLIGVVEWRKLVFVNIPNFLRGVAGRLER